MGAADRKAARTGCWWLEMQKQQAQQATASLHPRTDVMAMIQ